MIYNKIITIAVLTFAVANGLSPKQPSEAQRRHCEMCANFEPKIGHTNHGYTYT